MVPACWLWARHALHQARGPRKGHQDSGLQEGLGSQMGPSGQQVAEGGHPGPSLQCGLSGEVTGLGLQGPQDGDGSWEGARSPPRSHSNVQPLPDEMSQTAQAA